MDKQLRIYVLAVVVLAAMAVAGGTVAIQQRSRVIGLREKVAQLESSIEEREARDERVPRRRPPAARPAIEPATRHAATELRVEALQREVCELQDQLEQFRRAEEHPQDTGREARRVNLRERMEELRRNDPERYEAIQQQRESFARRAEDRIARQAAFITSLDTGSMTPGERADHERLVNAMAEAWDLFDSLQSGNADRDTRLAMRETMRDVGELMESARNTALRQYAAELGYDEQGARYFSQAIQELIEMTETPGSMFRGGRGRR